MIYLNLPIDIDKISEPEVLYNTVINKIPQGADSKLVCNTIFYYFNKRLQKEDAEKFIEYYYHLNNPIFGDTSAFYPLQNLQPNGGEPGYGAVKRSELYKEGSSITI